MKFHYFFKALLLSVFLGWAAPAVIFRPGIDAFQARFEKGETNAHRTGAERNGNVLFPENLPATAFPSGFDEATPAYLTSQLWRDRQADEYKIDSSGSTEKLKGLFQESLAKAGLNAFSVDVSENAISFSNPVDSVGLYTTPTGSLSVDSLDKIAITSKRRWPRSGTPGSPGYPNHDRWSIAFPIRH